MDVGVSDRGWSQVEDEGCRGGVGTHKYYRSDAQVEQLLRGRSWWDGRWSGREGRYSCKKARPPTESVSYH